MIQGRSGPMGDTSSRLLAILQSRSAGQPQVFIEQAELAALAGICVRQLRRVLVSLEKSGQIERLSRSYRLCPNRTFPMSEADISDVRTGHFKMSEPDMPIENKGSFYRSQYNKERARVDDDDVKKKATKPSSSGPAVALILAELQRHQPRVTRDVAVALLGNFRAKAPKITGEQAVGLLRAKAANSSKAFNMIGLLRNWTAEWFTTEDLADYESGQQRLNFEHSERMKAEAERLAAEEAKKQSVEAQIWSYKFRQSNPAAWDELAATTSRLLLESGQIGERQQQMAWFGELRDEQMYALWLEEKGG